jgi:hypothetical protein
MNHISGCNLKLALLGAAVAACAFAFCMYSVASR